MKKLNNLAFLCAKNSRSIAYFDILKKNNVLPSTIILLDVKKNYKHLKIKKNKFFNYNFDIEYFALKNKINLIKIKNAKINDPRCLKVTKNLKEKYIIYAANYGDILSKEYFKFKKKFIHVHPGILPTYKGSTTYYYEILEKNSISYSVIFQNKKIDNGRIIYDYTYDFKKTKIEKSKIDHVYDPYLRSIILLSVIQKLKRMKKIKSKKQTKKDSKTYYIIHPVLKHISILSKK
jgi:methionyl-tRNA formyltransferase